MPLSRRAVLALPILAAVPAFAQADYPTKAIRIIVPFAPGGSGDITSRLIGKYIEDKTGQPFVVENKPGANGIVGALDANVAGAAVADLRTVADQLIALPATQAARAARMATVADVITALCHDVMRMHQTLRVLSIYGMNAGIAASGGCYCGVKIGSR